MRIGIMNHFLQYMIVLIKDNFVTYPNKFNSCMPNTIVTHHPLFSDYTVYRIRHGDLFPNYFQTNI